MTVPLTRRRVLELTGAAAAVAALPPGQALAGRAAAFSQDLTAALPAGATAAGARHVLPVLRAPRRFDLIGLDFGHTGHVHAEVRARRRGGPWSAWAALHDATQPCWTGPADLFQVRFTGATRTLQARFVRVGRAAPRATAAQRVRASAAAPPIIARADWGAAKAPPRADPDFGEVQIGFVHHTVTANEYTADDSASIVLGIARYHIDHNGWNDIGYNFLVDRYGQIFEGRAGGIDQPVLGAQAQGYNSYSTGVACLGDCTELTFPAAGLESVARLLAWKLPLHGVPVLGQVTVASQGGAANRYRAGKQVTFERISGHRDGDATSCPGEALYGQLEALRDRVADLAKAISALTVRVEENRLRYPETALALTGLLRFADGAVPTGQPIQIQFQTAAGGAWELLQSVAAAPDGSFTTTLTAPASGRVRAVFPGDGVHPLLEAKAIGVRLVPELTLAIDPRRVRAGRRTFATGTVTPAPPSGTAKVLWQRRVRGVYYRTSRTTVPIVDGTIDMPFTPPRTGLYRVTVRAGGARIQRLMRAV